MSKRFELAKELARRLGTYAKEQKSKCSISKKGSNDCVTNVDVELEREIVKAIQEHFPGDVVQGEELSPTVTSVPRWIIDPIDGTKNYIRDIPFWSTCIAYKSSDEDSFGVVYFPDLDEFFEAIEGNGAFLNDSSLHVSTLTKMKKAYAHIDTFHLEEHHRVMKERWPLYQELFHSVYRVRNFGAASAALTGIAKGSFDININLSAIQHEWDYFPSLVIIREAGGVYEVKDGVSIAGNETLVTAVKKMIDKVKK